MARGAAAALALIALVAVGGCGGSEGVAAGATVNVYVAAGLCPAARAALGRAGGKAGEVEVRALCLAPVRSGGRLDLATVGANARRASEDSTTATVIGEAGKPAEFAEPILEEAGIAYLRASDGAAAMKRVLAAVEEAGTAGTLRTKVGEALG